MGIVVTVRTRDEERRIAQFCEAYKDVDAILVADGGSEDNTKEIAASFPNVQIRDFTERTKMQGGHWRNNDSAHANFLFEWAYSLEPDWIIYDDCDCRPNYLLRENYKYVLDTTTSDFVLVVRLYLWGLEEHFPNLSYIKDAWQPSLWAWRGNADLWTINVPPAYNFRIGDMEVKDLHTDAKAEDLFPPYCLLHYSWDDPDRVNQKVQVYRESGLIPSMLHPLDFGGPLEPLPEWAHE